jgi:predicted nucleotidyltransferase
VFTPDHREQISARVLERARADYRVIGAALTGSAASGAQDRWSDIDLFLGIADGIDRSVVLAEWTEWIRVDLGAIHYFDVRVASTVYRVFLLPDGLELDIAFAPAAEFGARGPQFHTVFGAPAAPEDVSPPNLDELIGRGWHHVLHARASIERNKPWQAEYWISALRDHTLALACVRLGERTDFAKGVHRLPREVTAPLEEALVRSFEPDELRRALRIATSGFLRELHESQPQLATRLEGPLLEAATLGS